MAEHNYFFRGITLVLMILCLSNQAVAELMDKRQNSEKEVTFGIPQSPPLTIIPGDNQVTVTWNDMPVQTPDAYPAIWVKRAQAIPGSNAEVEVFVSTDKDYIGAEIILQFDSNKISAANDSIFINQSAWSSAWGHTEVAIITDSIKVFFYSLTGLGKIPQSETPFKLFSIVMSAAEELSFGDSAKIEVSGNFVCMSEEYLPYEIPVAETIPGYFVIGVVAQEITLSDTILAIGEVAMDDSGSVSFTISNTGGADLVISDISVGDSTIFLVNPTSAIIVSDDSQMVLVTFCPRSEQTYIDTLIISNNDSMVSVVVTGIGVLSPPSKSCDFSGDGKILINDVIVFLLRARDNPDDPAVDWNGDGSYAINDAIILLLDIMNGNCPDVSVLLSAVGISEPLAGMETLSPGDISYVEKMMEQMELTPEQEAALRLTLYGVSEPASPPEAFSLSRNSPNPFNPSTTISFSVPQGASHYVSVKVFDLRGHLVRTMVNEVKAAGKYSVFWDGTDEAGRQVASGVYFCRMHAGQFVQTRKMVLLK